MKVLIQRCLIITVAIFSGYSGAFEIRKEASIKDTTTTILGLNHIGLSVQNLDKMLAFYQQSTNFELVRRETITQNKNADALFGHQGISYEIAVLKAPNMLFELVEFKHNGSLPLTRMPPQGSGMTHTCFQSPSNNPGYDKFMKAGADLLSRGGPVDIGGYGVTYAYVYDPEGNMVELEQLDRAVLSRAGYDSAWKDIGEDMWMSQVGLATHDMERSVNFYQKVLGFQPYRKADISGKVKFDEIVDIDNVHLMAGWFRLNGTSKMLEIWEYVNPATPKFEGVRDVTALGYSFSLEVTDIQAEYQRLTKLGVEFVGAPVKLGDFWQVYARDLDSNIFSLRQAVDPSSPLSVRAMDMSIALD